MLLLGVLQDHFRSELSAHTVRTRKGDRSQAFQNAGLAGRLVATDNELGEVDGVADTPCAEACDLAEVLARSVRLQAGETAIRGGVLVDSHLVDEDVK